MATVLLIVPSSVKFNITVKASWLSKYITSAIGLVQDCVIQYVEYNFGYIYLNGWNDTTYEVTIIPKARFSGLMEGHSDELSYKFMSHGHGNLSVSMTHVT